MHTYLLMARHSHPGGKAINDLAPAGSVLGLPDQLVPSNPQLSNLPVEVPSPSVSGSSSLPPSLGVPGQGHFCGVFCWLS